MKFNFFLITIFSVSCYSTSQLVKHMPNYPTSYVFEGNILKVKNAIKKAYYQAGYRGGYFDFADDRIILSTQAEKIFSSGSNKNDYYFSRGLFPESKVYFSKKNKPFPYYADFHIHISEIDSGRTKVEIYTFNSKIEIGSEFFPSLPHLVRLAKTKAVPPTTIEEYTILLKIGEVLGIEMPPMTGVQ
ncbi:MAG: hypothetical protein CRN43_06800 [Candidatus Nephrothrix sp. EaCA]|nr:MAG: hypothetical protein CRN43_06800 [Candidatus Nephrothrix sp. EaCA]